MSFRVLGGYTNVIPKRAYKHEVRAQATAQKGTFSDSPS